MAETALNNEKYGHSTLTIRGMGEVALLGSGEIDYSDGNVIESFIDFTTALAENLATDEEFGEWLIFNQLRPYEYRDGKTLNAKGRPVIDSIKDGARASRAKAEQSPRMLIQAERDEADVMVAKIVDRLEVGELYAVTSLDPKDALLADKKFWENEGYREGMAVLQVYYRQDQNTMLAGAYSIKQSNKAALSRVWAKYGKDLPADTPDNQWIKHGIRLSTDLEDAQEFGNGIIKAHQAEIGNKNTMMSVTEFIKDNKSLIQSCFEQYMVPLGMSLARGRANTEIQQLARQMLSNGAVYPVAESHSLMKLANGGHVDSEEVSVMEDKIRYAVVEELRKLLKIQLNTAPINVTSRTNPYTVPRFQVMGQAVFMQNMDQMMAANVAGGMAAGRSYGGCTPAGANGNEQANSLTPGAEQQDVFGGNLKKTESDDKDCEFISKSCPKCGEKNVKTKVTKTYISGSCGCKVRKK